MTATVLDGKYALEEILGKGGNGTVYAASNLVTGRRVAIKQIEVQEVGVSDEARARFVLEARAASALEHRNVVQVIDIGFTDHCVYMVLERLFGETLGDRIARETRLAPKTVGTILLPILDALSLAHEKGIVHRDLKPDNVYLAELRGETEVVPKLLDFGIAKWTGEERLGITKTGDVLGTPYYLAPEQVARSRAVDGRADLYSVGVIMYEALTGKPPFQADSYPALIMAIVSKKPPPANQLNDQLPDEYQALLDRALKKDPGERFQTAEEFRDALQRVVS
ncbi:MAG: serine/threonine-protein kinase [Myxococcota bacterium]